MDIMPSVTFVWAKKVALGCGHVFRYFLTFGGVKRKLQHKYIAGSEYEISQNAARRKVPYVGPRIVH